MARWATYVAESGTVAIQGVGEQSRTLGPGSRVDLDERLPSGITMGDALGRYLHLFEVDKVKLAVKSLKITKLVDEDDGA